MLTEHHRMSERLSTHLVWEELAIGGNGVAPRAKHGQQLQQGGDGQTQGREVLQYLHVVPTLLHYNEVIIIIVAIVVTM